MKSIFIMLLMLVSLHSFSQDLVTDDKYYILKDVDVRPEFEGGLEKFYRFVSENYKTPEELKNQNAKVFVSFIVEKDGSLSNIKTMRDAGSGSGEEAIRVLKESPKWKPGMKDGQPVRTIYHLPISVSRMF